MRLADRISDHAKLTDEQTSGLKRLGITTIRDLLFHFPSRHQNIKEITLIRDLTKGARAVVYGKLESIKTGKAYRKKIPLAEASVSDDTGKVRCVWFHQPYLANYLSKGTLVKLTGTPTEDKRGIYFANPEVEQVGSIPVDATHSLFEGNEEETYLPVYPETKGVTSRWCYHQIRKLLAQRVHEQLEDPVPDDIRKQYNLPHIHSALVWIHTPRKEEDSASARKRFSFQEIFFIQLARLKQRHAYAQNPHYKIASAHDRIKDFLKRFPFEPTGAQKRSIDDILKDFEADKPMIRLLEGDVGSGKTLVAAATAYAAVTTPAVNNKHQRLQTAYMAPTEVLARQHYQSFIEHFSTPVGDLPTQIALVTGSECRKYPSKVRGETDTHISRAQVLKWIANGEIPIVIGTHALIQKSVQFKNLAYTIIDEQHRFGVMQRMQFAQKRSEEENAPVPHLLSMTATPIPRTLALTVYGDLDLSILDEMPAGRKPVHTEIVPPDKRKEIYEHVHEELSAGHQVYVICPRIDEPDPQKKQALLSKAAKTEAARLQKDVFPEYTVAYLHSKMKPKEKEEVMERFVSGEINVLVATSVIEVGVNVPNATTIIIEGAERFGLAQLHQFRGRVLRSTHQAYCYIFSDSTENKRLKALAKTTDGFALAEEDLKLRGAGELSGARQWGVSDIGMEALQNIKMVEAARKEAQRIVETDPSFTTLPDRSYVKKYEDSSELHFE